MRRGQILTPPLIGLIIIAVTAIVLFTWQSRVEAIAEKSSDTAACETSARAIHYDTTKAFIKLQCATQQIAIRAEGAYRKSVRAEKDQLYLSSAQVERELKAAKQPAERRDVLRQLVYRVMASEMATCWRQFGEGRLDLFKSDAYFVSQYHCISCATVAVDAKVRDELGQQFSGFKDYLQTTPKDQSGITYDAYLRPVGASVGSTGVPFVYKVEVKPSGLETQAVDSLDISSPLAVIYQAEVPRYLFGSTRPFSGDYPRMVYLTSLEGRSQLQCDVLF